MLHELLLSFLITSGATAVITFLFVWHIFSPHMEEIDNKKLSDDELTEWAKKSVDAEAHRIIPILWLQIISIVVFLISLLIWIL